MGSVGAPEILVILVLALVVLGPERLPQAARTMGRWMGELRRVTGSLQSEVRDVVDEVMRPVNETATVATDSFTSTFSTSDARAGTEGVGPDPTTTVASSSDATGALPADVPLPDDGPTPAAESAPISRRPALPMPPVDPSLN